MCDLVILQCRYRYFYGSGVPFIVACLVQTNRELYHQILRNYIVIYPKDLSTVSMVHNVAEIRLCYGLMSHDIHAEYFFQESRRSRSLRTSTFLNFQLICPKYFFAINIFKISALISQHLLILKKMLNFVWTYP